MNTFKSKHGSVGWTPARPHMLDIWVRVMPVAITYANSGLAAAVATAWSLALAGERNDLSDCPPDQRHGGAHATTTAPSQG